MAVVPVLWPVAAGVLVRVVPGRVAFRGPVRRHPQVMRREARPFPHRGVGLSERRAVLAGHQQVRHGLAKAVFFGGALALVSCQRGFNSQPGAEGVGQAATEAFVTSFVVILVLDFVLSLVWDQLPLVPLFGPTQRTLF